MKSFPFPSRGHLTDFLSFLSELSSGKTFFLHNFSLDFVKFLTLPNQMFKKVFSGDCYEVQFHPLYILSFGIFSFLFYQKISYTLCLMSRCFVIVDSSLCHNGKSKIHKLQKFLFLRHSSGIHTYKLITVTLIILPNCESCEL